MWDDGQDGSDEDLARQVGCSPATVDTYRQDYSRLSSGVGVQAVEEGDLPLLTRRGAVWCVPIEAGAIQCEPWDQGRKRGCVMWEQCKEAVRLGHFIACERVLRSELVEEDGDET